MGEQDSDSKHWRDLALAEISSVKDYFKRKHNWQLTVVEESEQIKLYVRFQHKRHCDRVRVLRLVYGPGFPRERPREDFVDPNNFAKVGQEFWIDDGDRAFKLTNEPPAICLEGTWGFHQVLHRERDPLRANLNKLLLEIQQCFDETA